ncbi:serine/threonine-protein kinase [Mycobacterium sp.]|uniref:serine/threonine-protein kinase n=1 Tax=Mycobacterium sp. TaxID=1785 RepID=UPI0025FAD305|nr:serine/threonine-protein kinase [Mycobacterium sp.]MBW0012546.1 serine/threonine protein kinase [Mycobacterium sp.]
MSDARGSRVGSMFGPYHLKRLLGRGGMGEVYEAENTVKEWPCAVKLMTAEFSKDPVFRERMKREARICGRLQEPHVVPIHDYGEIDGQMFLEMRLIDGTDLDSVLKRYGPLTPARAVAIISQIASALDAAHAAGVMHRDVKPPNVLITRDDFAYLVDFGIASATTDEKLTQLGTAVGTWKYMAPERFSDDEVTYRADIYALACVLHECLTGSPPYASSSAGTLVSSHMMSPIPQPSNVRPGVPKAFDAVIARGMAKKPEDRYASAGDLALAAHEALSDPDQDHAADIVRRSQEATLSGPAEPTPALASTAAAAPPAGAQPGNQPPPPPTPPPGTPQSWAGQPGTPYQPPPGGNWGSPPQTPPPHQFGGPTPWNQPPAKPKRSPWPIIAGAAALVVILVVAVVGIWLATRGRNTDKPQAQGTTTSSTTGKNSTTPSTPTTTATGGDLQSNLLSSLPAGYPDGACTPTTPAANSIWIHAVAMVDCDQNTNPGGPSRAVYGLFPNADSLKRAFDDDVSAMQLANCPDGGSSPETWHYDQTPTEIAGMLACGTYKNHPNLIWSNQAKLVLSDVFGDPPTIEALHGWWAKYG